MYIFGVSQHWERAGTATATRSVKTLYKRGIENRSLDMTRPQVNLQLEFCHTTALIAEDLRHRTCRKLGVAFDSTFGRFAALSSDSLLPCDGK